MVITILRLEQFLHWINIPPVVFAAPPKPPIMAPSAEVGPSNDVEAAGWGATKRPPDAGWAGWVEPEKYINCVEDHIHTSEKVYILQP